jgi:hypothetical protein
VLSISLLSARSIAEQTYRLNDIAFDVNQDRPIARSDAFETVNFRETFRVNMRVSSIRINVWYTTYNYNTA